MFNDIGLSHSTCLHRGDLDTGRVIVESSPVVLTTHRLELSMSTVFASFGMKLAQSG